MYFFIITFTEDFWNIKKVDLFISFENFVEKLKNLLSIGWVSLGRYPAIHKQTRTSIFQEKKKIVSIKKFEKRQTKDTGHKRTKKKNNLFELNIELIFVFLIMLGTVFFKNIDDLV